MVEIYQTEDTRKAIRGLCQVQFQSTIANFVPAYNSPNLNDLHWSYKFLQPQLSKIKNLYVPPLALSI